MTINRKRTRNGHDFQQPDEPKPGVPLPVLDVNELIGAQLVALAVVEKRGTSMELAGRYFDDDKTVAVAARAVLACVDACPSLRTAEALSRLATRLGELHETERFCEEHRHVFDRH